MSVFSRLSQAIGLSPKPLPVQPEPTAPANGVLLDRNQVLALCGLIEGFTRDAQSEPLTLRSQETGRLLLDPELKAPTALSRKDVSLLTRSLLKNLPACDEVRGAIYETTRKNAQRHEVFTKPEGQEEVKLTTIDTRSPRARAALCDLLDRYTENKAVKIATQTPAIVLANVKNKRTQNSRPLSIDTLIKTALLHNIYNQTIASSSRTVPTLSETNIGEVKETPMVRTKATRTTPINPDAFENNLKNIGKNLASKLGLAQQVQLPSINKPVHPPEGLDRK